MKTKTMSSCGLVVILGFVAAASLAADSPTPTPLEAAKLAVEKAKADKTAAEKTLAKAEAAAQTRDRSRSCP